MKRSSTPFVVLSIAGSDSGGGAGIQTDLKTVFTLGGHACTAITALTSQNTQGVFHIEVPSLLSLETQIRKTIEDMPPQAVKIGMIPNLPMARLIAGLIREYALPNVVLDPVMVATSGDSLVDGDMVKSFRDDLFPIVRLATPNLKEAAVLAGREIRRVSDMEEAARKIADFGPEAVLVKGGHLEENTMTDCLYIRKTNTLRFLQAEKIPSRNLHGTGCTLSSAIASYLAQGLELPEAVLQGKNFITSAIRSSRDSALGKGHGGVLQHFLTEQELSKKYTSL